MEFPPNVFVLVCLGLLTAAILFGVGYWFGYTRAQMRVLEAEKRMVRRFRKAVDREPERKAGEDYSEFSLLDEHHQ